MSSGDFAAVAAAGIVSVVSPLLFRRFLMRLRVLDVPNERSSHSTPTLRGGGLAPLLGLVAAVIALLVGAGGAFRPEFLVLLVGALAIASVGMLEDIVGVTVRVRLALQLLLGAGVGGGLAVVTSSAWWWIPAVALFVAAYVNVVNFMDGLDGISALHAIVVGVSFAATALVLGVHWLAVVGLIIAAAFGGFLVWNLRKPRLFLGDVGSYLLGACIAIAAALAVASGVPIVATLAPLTVYVADTLLTLVRRILAGERWYEAHRLHAFQRLAQSGLPHVAVSIIVAVFTLCAAGFGQLSLLGGTLPTVVSVAGIALVVIVYLALPAMRGKSFRRARVLSVEVTQ